MSFQEETLMFSSLNVIDEAEYTFYTAFQDHQYKVTAHCMWLFRVKGRWKNHLSVAALFSLVTGRKMTGSRSSEEI